MDEVRAAVSPTVPGVLPLKVFISHSTSDRERVDGLVTRLREDPRIADWYAPRDLENRSGLRWHAALETAINESDVLLLLISPASAASRFVRLEVEYALSNIPIVPVILEPAELPPGWGLALGAEQLVTLADDLGNVPAIVESLCSEVRQGPPSAYGAPGEDEGADAGREVHAETPLLGNAATSRPHVGRARDLAGRDAEVAQGVAVLEKVATIGQSGAVLLLSGESGSGKTALAEELFDRAADLGYRLCHVACEPFHEGMSFFPIRELMRQLVTSGSVNDDVSRAYGRASSQFGVAELAVDNGGDPAMRRDSIIATFCNLAFAATRLTDATAVTPVLLFVDDLERIDLGSVDALLCLFARLGEGPVVLAGAYRSDLVTRDRSNPHALDPFLEATGRSRDRFTPIRLAPVTEQALPSVVEAMLGGHTDLSDRFYGRLYTETEGNPLFIREILRALSAPATDASGGSLTYKDDAWRFVGPVTAWQIPDSVENAIAERLKLIDPTHRTELELAAVIGRRFAFEVFANLSSSDESQLLDYLEALLNFDIIREISPSDETFEFSHGKIRDVLYESMSHLRRARVHAQVAEVLIRLDSQGADEDWSALIGEHLVLGRKYDDALPYLLDAARAAMSIQAAREAETLYAKWLDAAAHARTPPEEDRDQIELDRAEALKAATDYETARDLLREIIGRAVSIEVRGWALNHLGDIDFLRGDVESAIVSYRECESIAREDGDMALLCETVADLAELHMRMSERLAGVDVVRASSHAEKYNSYLEMEFAYATELGADDHLARAYRNRAKHDRTNGRLDEAVQGYEAALEKTDRRVTSHQYLIPYAKALRLVGRSREAFQRTGEVLNWSRQIGSLRSEAIARQYRGLIMYEEALETDSGFGPAREELALALSLHADMDFDQGRRETEVILGELELAAGDRAGAEAHFLSAYEDSPTTDAAVRAAAGELRANGEGRRADRILQATQSMNE